MAQYQIKGQYQLATPHGYIKPGDIFEKNSLDLSGEYLERFDGMIKNGHIVEFTGDINELLANREYVKRSKSATVEVFSPATDEESFPEAPASPADSGAEAKELKKLKDQLAAVEKDKAASEKATAELRAQQEAQQKELAEMKAFLETLTKPAK